MAQDRLEYSFIQRLQVERDQLGQKVRKLDEFIAGALFSTLGKAQQHLLRRQYGLMQQYLNVLDDRLADLQSVALGVLVG